eukprot:scaffold13022_cov48-Phaeocystis_antarctica.AAC.1
MRTSARRIACGTCARAGGRRRQSGGRRETRRSAHPEGREGAPPRASRTLASRSRSLARPKL